MIAVGEIFGTGWTVTHVTDQQIFLRRHIYGFGIVSATVPKGNDKESVLRDRINSACKGAEEKVRKIMEEK